MPFVVQHTPVGLLTRLAVEVGQVRRRDIQAQRDIQIQQMAWARAERGADIAARRAEQQQAQEFRQVEQQRAQMFAQRQAEEGIAIRREEQQIAQTFALQRIEAAKISRERIVTQETRRVQEQLQQAVSQAEAMGIYDPKQIQQMQIFADLGDESGLRRIMSYLPRPAAPPKPTAKQKELIRQSGAVRIALQKDIESFDQRILTRQKDIDGIDDAWSKKYPLAAWEAMQKLDLEFMSKDVRGSIKKRRQLVAEQQALQMQKQEIIQEAERMEHQIQMGVTIPQQITKKARRVAKQRREKIDAIKRVEKRKQADIRTQIREIQPRLKIDTYADPATETIRVQKERDRITKLREKLTESYEREDAALSGIITPQRITPNEENAIMDALLAETGGDVEAAKRLMVERSSQ